MLSFYAQSFGTVEINNTFYRQPTAALLEAWARETPPVFRFALKAPQRITHQLRLKDASEPTLAFCEVARRLGRRLGPLLFQLPPHLRFDAGRLRDFLALLPAGLEYAVEFRSEGWFNDETYGLLSERRVALCVADSEALATPLVATAPFGYLRRREDAPVGTSTSGPRAYARPTVGNAPMYTSSTKMARAAPPSQVR
jgi:uncharacterized protein YecE (DUF72 family)